jgi:hypothetical protein
VPIVAFVNKQGGAEKHETRADAGLPIDFDPDDPTIVKVHYDLAAWGFDPRAELSEALAEHGIPHAWDGDELIVPEAAEELTDELFDRLEEELGPFPVALGADDESTEFGLDEWSDADRSVLTEAIIEAEIPHRWDGSTLLVARDAEESVDDLLDAIEAGELMSADAADSAAEPPPNALSDIFLAATKLAKDPFDAKSRNTLLDLHGAVDAAHPPYALAPRVWERTVDGIRSIVERIHADADGGRTATTEADDADDADDAESSEFVDLARALRDTVRPYV